jgi:hypothetical protein
MGDVSLSGRVDLVQPFEEALSFELRKYFPHRTTNGIPASEQSRTAFIHELENVLGSRQDRDEPGRTREAPALTVVLGR